ncbi:N-formylglutamate amidohydrolase [Marivita sp.]|uniref:N-formylglutamate amidohydrolase n=1 Tax=Marivita sp. TaxID=2003365 RepID=UPI003F705996
MLLQTVDPSPVLRGGNQDSVGIMLSCEHAGLEIPVVLGDLGLAPEDLRDHIGWDPGALDVTIAVSRLLDAPYVAQRYSRLVIDSNRPHHAPDLAPALTDTREVPGNVGLSDDDVTARWDEIHQPFHAALAATLAGKMALVSIHSFTSHRRSDEMSRTCGIGVLARDGNPLFRHLMHSLPRLIDDPVAENTPYEIEDASDYTIPVHGEAQSLPHALIEIRNDLISDRTGVSRVATALANALKEFKP